MLCSGKYEAEVRPITEDCAHRIVVVLLKLTTDRHEASWADFLRQQSYLSGNVATVTNSITNIREVNKTVCYPIRQRPLVSQSNRENKSTALRERKPLPTPKFQPKVIRDSNPDFRIIPDPDVCRHCPKMLRMHYSVSISHFAKYIIGRWLCKKSKKIPLFRIGKTNEKVIGPHADSDHPKILITSKGSPLAYACQVWSISVSAFVSYPVYRMTDRQTDIQTDRQNDHITSASSVEVNMPNICVLVHT